MQKIEQKNTRAGKICYRRVLFIVILFILHVLLFGVVYVILHSYTFNYCKKKIYSKRNENFFHSMKSIWKCYYNVSWFISQKK